MDWNDPAHRAQLIERVGPAEYRRQHDIHLKTTIVATINGHPIRPVPSRFGWLYQVGGTLYAFQRIGEAAAHACKEAVDRAIVFDDLDQACAIVQQAAGIESGDGAGMYFSGQDDMWKQVSPDARRRMIDAWLELEFGR
jgi:hypothetical protein